MERVNLTTTNILDENVEKLAELFPEVVTEVRESDGSLRHTIDVEALKERVGDVAEGQRERYQFTWPGKRDAKQEAYRPIDKCLRPCPEESVNWDTTENLYIEGDNLDALKLLRNTYAGKIKMIYIDPPYNTGHDFIYDDDFALTKADYDAENGDYDEEGGRLVANPESNGRFHSDWCSMMYPRLLLARDLLSEDGAIFISIDDNESKNLQAICDEVFGEDCFVGNISWQRTYSIRNDSKGVPTEVEHLLCYSKQVGWQPGKLPRTEAMNAKYSNPDGDRCPWRTDNAYASDANTHQGMVYAIQHPFTGELVYPANGSHWRYSQEAMLKEMNGWCSYELRDLNDAAKRADICRVGLGDVKQGVKAIVLAKGLEESRRVATGVLNSGPWPRFFFTKNGKGGIARKTYLDDVGGRLPTNFWPFSETGHTDEAKKELQKIFDGDAPFDTPKPVRLINRILTIACDDRALVLDFFSGSATAAEAVMRNNFEDGRECRFILVQLPEKASLPWGDLCGVGKERIRRAGKMIAEEVEDSNRQLKLGEDPKKVPDIGFRVLKIDSSNFRDVSAEPAQFTQDALMGLADNLKPDRTAEDLLFQVMPQLQIPLSASIEKLDIQGFTVYSVDGGRLVACFDAGVTTDAIAAMAKLEPDYAVMRDASFVGDDVVSNFGELFKTYSPATITKVI